MKILQRNKLLHKLKALTYTLLVASEAVTTFDANTLSFISEMQLDLIKQIDEEPNHDKTTKD